MKTNAQWGRQSGTAMVEYCVVSLVVVSVLFVPLPGVNDSLLGYLMNALRQFQSHTTYLLSLP